MGVTVLAANNAIVLSCNVELPLSGAMGLAVDDEGRIYVSTSGFSRIQIYSKHGEHITSIHSEGLYPVPDFAIAPGGHVRIELDSIPAAEFWKVRHDRDALKLTPDDAVPDKTHYQESGDTIKMKSGTIYRFGVFSWAYPTVVRVDSQGAAVVVSQPLYLWMARQFVPFVFVFVASAIVAGATAPSGSGLLPKT